MFGRELNRFSNCYLNQVAMVESKFEKNDISFKKRINMPANVFTRSPLKNRQNNPFVGNTPSRKNQTMMLKPTQDQSRRTSISPLKNRRQMTMMANAIPQMDHQPNYTSARTNQNFGVSNSQVSRSKKTEMCQNHPTKQAKYYISIEDQDLPFCEKCGIILISQGKRLTKFDENVNSSNWQSGPAVTSSALPSLLEDYNNPRRPEVSNFLLELQSIMKHLDNKKLEFNEVISKADAAFAQQVSQLDNYYSQIIQTINSHKSSVEASLLEQKNKAIAETVSLLETINEAISDSKMMKEDILSSLHLIRDAEEKDYRPIMESYKKNAKKFKTTSNSITPPPIQLTPLHFVDATEALQTMLNAICVIWPDEEPMPEKNRKHSKHSSMNFSFQGCTEEPEHGKEQSIPVLGSRIFQGPISEDENPVELLAEQEHSQQRFMKSSLKDSNGLYSEFDDFAA